MVGETHLKDASVVDQTTTQGLGRVGLNVCVFCSAMKVPEKYSSPAGEFARLLAERGHTLIWGGSKSGLMETIAENARHAGAQIIGVTTDSLKQYAHPDADEMIITTTLNERKAMMLERADVLVALPGGLGTLDEITEIVELRKQRQHQKPVVVLNTDHFYDGLQQQFTRMQEDGFLPVDLVNLVQFADAPQAAIETAEELSMQ